MASQPPATKRSRRTRIELSRAVHDEVARTGAVDVASIARNAGVSPATFYAHFDTHDDALSAALDLSLAAVVGVTDQRFQIEALLDHGLEHVVSQLVRNIVSSFDEEALVMRACLARLPHHRGIRDIYRKHEALSREHLARQIGLGQQAGLLRKGDPQHRATSLLVLTQGFNNPLLLGTLPVADVIDDLRRVTLALLAP